MYIYILLIILTGVIFLFRSNFTQKQVKILAFVLYILLSIIAGFRYMVGTDFSLYQGIYYSSLGIVYSSNFIEIGYLYLNKIFLLIGFDFQFFLVFLALIVNGLFILGGFKLSRDPLAVIFFYVTSGIYFSTFNIIRQSIVMAIVFLLLVLLFKNRKYLFTITTIPLYAFHRSVLVVISFALLFYASINPVLFLAVLLLVILVLYLPFINDLVLIIFNFLPEKYDMYANQILNSDGTELINLIMPTIILMFILTNYKKMVKLDTSTKGLINIFYVYYFIVLLSTKFLLFYRVSNYFEIIQLLILPQIILLFRGKDKKLVNVVIALCFITYIIGKLLAGHYGVVPYQFKIGF
ncbi:EpsG family protein [Terribacillus saccharophilus]|uniref:EpsG family protein n=1 Tax=Terribacillus saccharophilus TaxID=361277 RepID=UPI003D277756